MDRSAAQSWVSNLLDRLLEENGKYTLPGGVLTAAEVEALRLLADVDAPGPAVATPAPAVTLNLDCLKRPPASGPLMCIDFGTAFSKVAVWQDGAESPTALDLGVAAGVDGIIVESSAYITDGKIFFGPVAREQLLAENDADRAMFISPKELFTHTPDEFESDRPDKTVDPTGRFKSRELLTLYLAYLTALGGNRLAPIGIADPLVRRFAAPGWGDSQISEPSAQFRSVAAKMSTILVDAQILADSIDFESWRRGLEVKLARAALDALALERDHRWNDAGIIERPVLEAVAAATGIRDQLVNTRPQVLVVDVGAGTTDIGLFKYMIAKKQARVSPYAGGMKALKIAGNRLDDALIRTAWTKTGLAGDSGVRAKFERLLRREVRDRKRDLFEAGSVEIAVADITPVQVDIDDFEKHPSVADFKKKFGQSIADAMNGAGIGSRNFLRTSEPNIAVLTGGGGKIPFLRRIAKEPIVLDEGTAYFEIEEGNPSWLADADPAIQEVFPQLAVATGGCSPDLPDERNVVRDTSQVGARHIAPTYKN